MILTSPSMLYIDISAENVSSGRHKSNTGKHRKKQSARKKGHIKNLWCSSCKEIRKFYEIRDCDLDIRIEDLKAGNEQCICIGRGGSRYDGCTERIIGEDVSVM